MADADPPPSLPKDQYAHSFAPTEWWWHTGTLTVGERIFGFEINAASFSEVLSQFTQIMITDVQNKRHYSTTTVMPQFDIFWAETDITKPWYARLGGPPGANGTIEMRSPVGAIMPMSVVASFQDDWSKTPCSFDLLLTQTEAPLMVWGTGIHPVNPQGKTPLERNNYYYSFTKLKAAGTLRIGHETFNVGGMTWMDHEWGAFSVGQKWVLQDMQLSNGVHISNFFTTPPVKDQRTPSFATILTPDGKSTFVQSFATPKDPVWTSLSGTQFCMTFLVEIPSVQATLIVTTPVQDQAFSPGNLYEGVAHVTGEYGNDAVSGTAWNEQALSGQESVIARLYAKA
jgi:predicted secreted hydrolase